MSITIAAAREGEAGALSEVLTASITELCTREHDGDPELLAGWLSSKTPDHVSGWITSGRTHLLAAWHDGTIAGVGATMPPVGEIILNYVAPSHRGAGISSALLAQMEADLAAEGHRTLRLVSTLTAHAFHRKRGWQDDGPPVLMHGVKGWPMCKEVRAGQAPVHRIGISAQ